MQELKPSNINKNMIRRLTYSFGKTLTFIISFN